MRFYRRSVPDPPFNRGFSALAGEESYGHRGNIVKRITQRVVPALLLILAGLCGCTRSPEARRDKYVSKGKEFLEKKDYSRAILQFRNAVEVMPKDSEVYHQIGIASLGSGDLKNAVLSFKKTIELNPNHIGARLKLAQLMVNASEEQWVKQGDDRLRDLMRTAPVTPDMLNTLALAEMKLRKTSNAIELLEKAVEQAPQELAASIMLARAKLIRNDVNGAEDVLKKACEGAPTSADPRVVLGEFYLSQKRPLEAQAQFQHALRIDSKSGQALSDLARLQYALDRKSEAEESFKRVAALPVKVYKPMYGLFLFGEGRREEAVREFEKLSKEDPDDRLARTQLVAAYRAVGRVEDAQRILDDTLKKNGKDTDALLQRGEMRLAVGKYDQAETDFNNVVRLKPDSAELHYLLARLHRARGSALRYRQELSEALRLNLYLLPVRLELVEDLLSHREARAAMDVISAAPNDQKDSTPLTVQRNWVLWTLQDFAGMRKGIDEGLARDHAPDLLIQDGVWKLHSGNFAGAQAALEQALNIDPGDVRGLSALNLAYRAQKQNAVALKKVQEYIMRTPKSAPAQEVLGLLLMANGDRQQARSAFQAAKAADPTFVRADLSIVQVDVIEGELEKAERKLQDIISVDRTNTLAHLWLGNINVTKGNPTAALEQYRQVVAADGGNAQALNNFAYLLAEVDNQPTEALKYAQKAKELVPDSAEYSDTLGWILYRKGLYSLAVQELERAVAKQANPVWKYHLAMAYAKAGDLKRGRTVLEAALKLNPNAPEAKVAQQMLPAPK